jgi:hypothetical protein
MPAVTDAEMYLHQAKLYAASLEKAKAKFAEQLTSYGVEHAMVFVSEELVRAEYDDKVGRLVVKMLGQGLTMKDVMLEVRKSAMRVLTNGSQSSSLFGRAFGEEERRAAVRWLETAEGWLDK